MKFRNRSQYLQEDVKIARIARAMGHPARITILRLIAANESSCFNDISKKIPLAESTVSQHVSELKKAGLLRVSSTPPKVKYSISHGDWKIARKQFKEFTRQMVGKNDRHK